MIPALFVFFIWALPGAIIIGLSLGVQRINKHVPNPVYALHFGVNAATVGIIALVAVRLARKAIITDPVM
jgi:chromate transport protein ChrA